MLTFKKCEDEGDTYYIIYDGARAFAEVWNEEDVHRIIKGCNPATEPALTLDVVMSGLSPTEPAHRLSYDDDIDRLITAARQCQHINTGRMARRSLMAFLAARFNAYMHEVPAASDSQRLSAQGGLRILITISFNLKPGMINGLSKTHTPVHNLWSLDAQQHWAELSISRSGP
jgi:hypothetical protein